MNVEQDIRRACRARRDDGYPPEFWAMMAASLIEKGIREFGREAQFDEWQHLMSEDPEPYALLSVRIIPRGESEIN